MEVEPGLACLICTAYEDRDALLLVLHGSDQEVTLQLLLHFREPLQRPELRLGILEELSKHGSHVVQQLHLSVRLAGGAAQQRRVEGKLRRDLLPRPQLVGGEVHTLQQGPHLVPFRVLVHGGEEVGQKAELPDGVVVPSFQNLSNKRLDSSCLSTQLN